MNDPWRYRCPEGHASIRNRVGGGYWCKYCQKKYEGEPIDMKQADVAEETA